MRFQNGSNKVAIELRVVQFWSEIILAISNFEITRMISDQIALHSVQLPLFITPRMTSTVLILAVGRTQLNVMGSIPVGD